MLKEVQCINKLFKVLKSVSLLLLPLQNTTKNDGKRFHDKREGLFKMVQ